MFELAPLRERVQSRGGDPEPLSLGVLDQRLTDRREGLAGLPERLDDGRLCLDDALEQFVVEAPLQQGGRIALVDEFVGAGGRSAELVDDVELLFDTQCAHPAERVRRTRLLHRTGDRSPGVKAFRPAAKPGLRGQSCGLATTPRWSS